MTDVKWIKLASDIFNNRKIKTIETRTDGDAIIVLWLKLLCLAGSTNDCGLVYLTPEIPYTAEILAAQFGRPLPLVLEALQIFERFGMIEKTPERIQIKNWDKYQSIEGLERVREQTRLRIQRHREAKKIESVNVTLHNVTSNAEVTHRNALESESEIEKEEKEKKKKEKPAASAGTRPEDQKHKHGEYSNVLLTTSDLAKLQAEFPDDYQKRIEELSAYMKSTGKAYKDHLATIRNWARRDKEKKQEQERAKEKPIGTRENYDYGSGANAAIYAKLKERGKGGTA